MNKLYEYEKLVDDVNNCTKCNGITAKKGAVILEHYASNHVNLWSYWQGNLSPEILVIGQDWGATSMIKPAIHMKSDSYRASIIANKNPTDNNLAKLFLTALSINILEEQRVFFTNSIFCYKSGGLVGNTRTAWFNNCNALFMDRLISILNPNCIITLGNYALNGLKKCGNILYPNGNKLGSNVKLIAIVQNPNPLTWVSAHGEIRINLFPVFHTGSLPIVAKNRIFEDQIKDWQRIKPFVHF